jgi:hypothetical protein
LSLLVVVAVLAAAVVVVVRAVTVAQFRAKLRVGTLLLKRFCRLVLALTRSASALVAVQGQMVLTLRLRLSRLLAAVAVKLLELALAAGLVVVEVLTLQVVLERLVKVSLAVRATLTGSLTTPMRAAVVLRASDSPVFRSVQRRSAEREGRLASPGRRRLVLLVERRRTSGQRPVRQTAATAAAAISNLAVRA